MHDVAIPLAEFCCHRRKRASERRTRPTAVQAEPQGPSPSETSIHECVRQAISESEIASLLPSLRAVSKAVNDAMQAVLAAVYPNTTERVIAAVAARYGISHEAIMGRSRPDRIAFPRQVAMYLLMQRGMRCTHVGEVMGGRNHGTVLHAVQAVENRMQTDRVAKAAVDELAGILGIQIQPQAP